ncbi:MAG TPA: NADP-dependent succinic semialdehyde dehydrogenase [Marmoricola sp.]
MAIETVNPATGETLATFDETTDEQLEQKLATAARCYADYRLSSMEDRSRWMHRAGEILEERVEEVGRMMTTEMGKTLVAAKAEVTKCAKTCHHYADHAAEYLADEPTDGEAVGAVRAYGRYQPIGPVLAVMPWNFPLWQVIRFAAPALMAGNVGLLKHASNVPQTALFLEELFRDAGFPEGCFQTLLISSGKVEKVLRDQRVVAATLTGSGPAGRSVGSIAGDEIKHTVLELGGSDPFIVMPSADLEKAAEVGTNARLLNNGQSCINAKRFIVHRDVADRFTELFVEQMSSTKVGDPMAEETDMGPMVSEQGRADVEELVEDAVKRGARVLCGGERIDGPGWYYPATVITDITEEMRLYREEAFGPVASLYVVDDIDEAIELANVTEFGLGSNAWTNDEDEIERFVRDLEAGAVFINGNTTSYPELPFGGVKGSGYGRELSAHGMREFCNLKTVWVGAGGQQSDKHTE